MLRYFPRTTRSPSSEPLPGPLGSVNEEAPLVLTSQSPSGPTTDMLSILASQAETSQFLLDEGISPKKKRKCTEQKKFTCKIKELAGLELEPAPDKNNRSASHCCQKTDDFYLGRGQYPLLSYCLPGSPMNQANTRKLERDHTENVKRRVRENE